MKAFKLTSKNNYLYIKMEKKTINFEINYLYELNEALEQKIKQENNIEKVKKLIKAHDKYIKIFNIFYKLSRKRCNCPTYETKSKCKNCDNCEVSKTQKCRTQCIKGSPLYMKKYANDWWIT
jgi:regulatory protein YycH of two-component signal transduction system YycFG